MITKKTITFNIGLNTPLHLYQISDTHMVYNDEVRDQEWLNGKIHFAKMFNEYVFDYYKNHSSIEIMNKIIDDINKDHNDLVILSGDIIDYYNDDNQKLLNETIKKINTKSLFIPGNHEKLDKNKEKKYLDKYNRYQKIDLGEIVVLGFDNGNKSFSGNDVKILKEELEKDKKILIVYHIPVMNNHNKKELENINEYFCIDYEQADAKTKEFIDLMVNNKKIIGVLCGHFHGYHENSLSDYLKQFVASSGLIGYVNEIIIK